MLKKKLYCCDLLETLINEREVGIVYKPEYRDFGIRLFGNDELYEKIYCCPWCGSKFPKSLRAEWRSELEELEYYCPWNESIPSEFTTDEWWKKRNL